MKAPERAPPWCESCSSDASIWSRELSRLPIGAEATSATADAVLLIGDRAMHVPRGDFVEVWDLGDEWCRWADLPFVFAMWVARDGVELGELADVH